jgi:hypothetical protein
MLAQEVEAFKGDCRSKGKAAGELAENVQADCVNLLREMVDKQEEEFKAIINQSRLTMNEMDNDN